MNERERKYRYWYNEGGGYTYSEGGSMERFWSFYEADSSYYTLEDFFGAQDGVGKDIYEGDIVQFVNSYGQKQVEAVVYVSWTCVDSGDDYSYTSGLEINGLSDLSNCEVIGNIHQNPELLK